MQFFVFAIFLKGNYVYKGFFPHPPPPVGRFVCLKKWKNRPFKTFFLRRKMSDF